MTTGDESLPADSWATSAASRAVMLGNRSKDTGPELALRRALYSLGYRYRLQWPVPGASRRRVDIAFPGRKVAVEVRGCFWHGCPEHATWPKANAGWWREKIEGNRQRDRETEAKLRNAGWAVLVIWEHEPVEQAVGRVIQAVGGRRRSGSS